MMNQIVFVGRLVRDIEVKETENGGKYAVLSIAVPRSFKNSDGIYETDFIDCKTFNNIAENTADYCRKGDIVGIKGRLQSKVEELENGTTKKELEVIAERVTFLSSNKQKED